MRAAAGGLMWKLLARQDCNADVAGA